MHYEEERQNNLLAGLLYRLLGFSIGLILAIALVAGLYVANRPALRAPGNEVAAVPR